MNIHMNTKLLILLFCSVMLFVWSVSFANDHESGKSSNRRDQSNTHDPIYINGFPARADVILVKQKSTNFMNDVQNAQWSKKLQKIGARKVCSAFPNIKNVSYFAIAPAYNCMSRIAFG